MGFKALVLFAVVFQTSPTSANADFAHDFLQAAASIVRTEFSQASLDARIARVRELYESAGIDMVPGDDAIRDALQ